MLESMGTDNLEQTYIIFIYKHVKYGFVTTRRDFPKQA